MFPLVFGKPVLIFFYLFIYIYFKKFSTGLDIAGASHLWIPALGVLSVDLFLTIFWSIIEAFVHLNTYCRQLCFSYIVILILQ